MGDIIDLENGLIDFLQRAYEAFSTDPGYSEDIARQASSLSATKRLLDGVD